MLEAPEVIVSRLKKREALPQQEQENLDAGLFFHAIHGHGKMVAMYLNRGANPNAVDSDGNTPLILAATAGHTGVVHLLLQGWADPDLKNSMGQFPLLQAVSHGAVACARAIIPHMKITHEIRAAIQETSRQALRAGHREVRGWAKGYFGFEVR